MSKNLLENGKLGELEEIIKAASNQSISVEELEEVIAPACGCGCGGLC